MHTRSDSAVWICYLLAFIFLDTSVHSVTIFRICINRVDKSKLRPTYGLGAPKVLLQV